MVYITHLSVMHLCGSEFATAVEQVLPLVVHLCDIGFTSTTPSISSPLLCLALDIAHKNSKSRSSCIVTVLSTPRFMPQLADVVM